MRRRIARAGVRSAIVVLAAAPAALGMVLIAPATGAGLSRPINDLPPEVVGSPLVGERLVCGSGSWSGFVSGFTYEWFRDGVEFATGVTHTVTPADKGHSLWCVVTAVGGEAPYPKATSSNSVFIPGGSPASPPHDESPPRVTGQATLGATLVCLPGTWSGNPAPTFSYRWSRDEEPLAGSSSSHEVVAADAGHSLSCEVTGANSAGSETASSSPVAVPAIKPLNTSPPQVLGAEPLDPGDSTTCRPGTWTETPRPTFAYTWIRDRGLPGEAAIEGATSSGYTVQPADRLHTLSCRVTATNSAGSTEAASGNVLKVRGTRPQNTAPPVIEGRPISGETLTCSTGSWTGAPAPTYAFAWVRDRGAPGEQTIAATREYQVVPEDRGHALSCAVTATNSEGSSSQPSGPVVVPAELPGQEAPLELTAPSVAGTPALGATLTCSAGTWSGNPSPTISDQWLRDGVAIPAATGGKYLVVAADQGHSLACRVTALNEEGVASATSANALEIPGVPPEDVEAPEVTGSPAVGSVLTCAKGAWNGAPAPTFTFRWLREGAVIASATSQTYVVAGEDGGKSISCRVRAANTAGSAEAASANAVEVPGREPRNTSAPLIAGTPRVGETLTCSPGTWSGQPIPSLTYRWLLSGTAITEATASTLVVPGAAAGFDITCEVTATNHEGRRSATSAPVHVPGVGPQVVERPAVSGNPTVGGRLTCGRGVWKATPPPAFSYRWLRDSATVAGATEATYAVAPADQGHALSCAVTATNTEGTSEALSSNAVAVAGPTVRTEIAPLSSVLPDVEALLRPSKAQILASMGRQLTYAQKRARVTFVRRSGVYSFSFTALAAGRLEASWYQVARSPLHPSGALKRVVLAQATASFAGATTKLVKLRLTSAGRTAFSHGSLVKLFVKGAFIMSDAAGVSWVAPSTLSH